MTKILLFKRGDAVENKNIAREDELNDAREMASFIADKRENFFIHQIIGIVLISYMNGIFDAEHASHTSCTVQVTT